MFVDDLGQFNLAKYSEMHQMLGLPAIAREDTLRETLNIRIGETFSYDRFREILLESES